MSRNVNTFGFYRVSFSPSFALRAISLGSFAARCFLDVPCTSFSEELELSWDFVAGSSISFFSFIVLAEVGAV